MIVVFQFYTHRTSTFGAFAPFPVEESWGEEIHLKCKQCIKAAQKSLSLFH